MNHKI